MTAKRLHASSAGASPSATPVRAAGRKSVECVYANRGWDPRAGAPPPTTPHPRGHGLGRTPAWWGLSTAALDGRRPPSRWGFGANTRLAQQLLKKWTNPSTSRLCSPRWQTRVVFGYVYRCRRPGMHRDAADGQPLTMRAFQRVAPTGPPLDHHGVPIVARASCQPVEIATTRRGLPTPLEPTPVPARSVTPVEYPTAQLRLSPTVDAARVIHRQTGKHSSMRRWVTDPPPNRPRRPGPGAIILCSVPPLGGGNRKHRIIGANPASATVFSVFDTERTQNDTVTWLLNNQSYPQVVHRPLWITLEHENPHIGLDSTVVDGA